MILSFQNLYAHNVARSDTASPPIQSNSKILSLIFFSLFAFTLTPHGQAQAQLNEKDVQLQEQAVKVYLDIHHRIHDYVKTEIPYVNYVRDRLQADVHIMMMTQRTGGNGAEYTLNFIGQQNYTGFDDTLKYVARKTDTEEMIRSGITHTIKLGLMRYVARTPLSNDVTIGYRREAAPTEVVDPWKNWVFGLGVSTDLRGESAYSRIDIESSISADRITPDWILSFYAESDYNESNYDLDDGVYKSISRQNRFRGLVVKSLGEHWSAGTHLSANSSTYSNNKMAFGISPAIEYNIFPYSEANRREFRFQYRIGYTSITYREETIYDETYENLFHENLSAAFEARERWGSISTSISGFHYFHDISKYSVSFNTWLSLRVIEGFSVTLRGRASAIHNQLYLTKGEATEEELLLRRKAQATSFNYSISVGLRYTFGSIYSNVVNPRFGR